MFGKTEKKVEVVENKDIQATKASQGVQSSRLNEMDKLFDQFLTNRWLHPFSWNIPGMDAVALRSEVRVPSVDIIEKDGNVIVRAEIPGVDKKDVDVTLNGNNLTIKGKSRHETKEATEDYHHCEISTASFSRTLTLPTEVDNANVKATFTNGLLEVTLPKVENSNQNKISVE